MSQQREKSRKRFHGISAYDLLRAGVTGIFILLAFWYIQSTMNELEIGEKNRFLAQVFIIMLLIELVALALTRQTLFSGASKQFQFNIGGIVGCCVLIQILTLFLFFFPR